MKKRITVYWLIPSKPYRNLFRAIIRILAHEFDAPRFEPHLTLCVAQDGLTKNFLGRVKAAPIKLRVGGIAHSSKFTKTLFVRCKKNRALEKLIVDLGGDAKTLRDSHVSLIYKNISERTRKDLAMAIRLPFGEIVFDSVKAVHCRVPVQTRADVETWRVIATKRLR